MKKSLLVGFAAGLLCALLPAATGPFQFFTPAQTTNVINALISASAASFDGNQFNAASPYSVKNGALGTNWNLTTPTLTYATLTGGTLTGGTNSGTALLSVTTPSVTGFLFGRAASPVIASTNLTDSGSAIASTLPFLATVGANVGSGGLIRKIINSTNTVDIGLTGVGATVDTVVTVTGADQVNNNVFCTTIGSYQVGYSFYAWVNATNQVTIRLTNIGLGATDPAAIIFSITVLNL